MFSGDFFGMLGVALCNGLGSLQQQQLSSSKMSHGAISSKWGIVHPNFIIIFSRCITYLNNCLLLSK